MLQQWLNGSHENQPKGVHQVKTRALTELESVDPFGVIRRMVCVFGLLMLIAGWFQEVGVGVANPSANARAGRPSTQGCSHRQIKVSTFCITQGYWKTFSNKHKLLLWQTQHFFLANTKLFLDTQSFLLANICSQTKQIRDVSYLGRGPLTLYRSGNFPEISQLG